MSANVVITVIFCLVIIVIGIRVLYGLLKTKKQLKSIYDRFKEEIIQVDISYTEDIGENDISTSDYRRIRYDRGKLADNRDKYYAIYADYVVYSQLISIFPLLGIMGTVLGLVMNSFSDVDKLIEGLGMALWTTLVGLIFSVFLKWIDANDLGKMVNLIDSEFEKADSIIQHQIMAEEIKHSIEKIDDSFEK